MHVGLPLKVEKLDLGSKLLASRPSCRTGANLYYYVILHAVIIVFFHNALQLNTQSMMKLKGSLMRSILKIKFRVGTLIR